MKGYDSGFSGSHALVTDILGHVQHCSDVSDDQKLDNIAKARVGISPRFKTIPLWINSKLVKHAAPEISHLVVGKTSSLKL